MKALTFASVLAISMAGVACSERAPIEPEEVSSETDVEIQTTETAQAEAPAASEFNLRFPGTDTQAASGGFNLRDPGTLSDQQGGLRLPDGAVREDAFSDIPEIRAPITDAPSQDAGQVEDPDDEIIRLD